MNWDISLNGTSLTSKVIAATVTSNHDTPIREINVELIDNDIYSSIDWTKIPSSPQLVVTVEKNGTWHNLGSFFVERPTHSVDPNSGGMRGLWGRSRVAMLAEPFSRTITKTWGAQTDLYSLIEEVMAGSNIYFNRAASWRCPNFMIPALSYSCDKAYPIDIITELADLCGAVVVEDESTGLYLTILDYETGSPDLTLNDVDIASCSEELIFPDFGNRVMITADNSSSGYSMEISAETQCVSEGGNVTVPVYARLTDEEGHGINGVPVLWSLKTGLVQLLDGNITTTGTMTVASEKVKSDGFYQFQTKFIPDRIVKVTDKTGKAINIAGHSIEGNTVTLGEMLKYCDQTLLVTYECTGVATNHIKSLSNYGNDTVSAAAGGAKASVEIYVGNPCKCAEMDEMGDEDDPNGGGGDQEDPGKPKYGVSVLAIPETICKTSSATTDPLSLYYGQTVCACPSFGCISQILITAEEYAPITDSRTVTMKEVTEDGALGHLEWEKGRLGKVKVEGVPGVIKSVDGKYPVAASKFYWYGKPHVRVKVSGEGEAEEWVDVAFVNVDGKYVELRDIGLRDLEAGMEVEFRGTILGGAINYFTGLKEGTATLKASVQSVREEPMSATCDVKIVLSESDDDEDEGFDEDQNKGGSSNTTANLKGEVQCLSDTGTKLTCSGGQVCCQGAYGRGCYDQKDCAANGAGDPVDLCYTKDCTDTLTDACLQARFGEALSTQGAFGCSCEELCDKEFRKMGITQTQLSSGSRWIGEVLENQFGVSPDSPEYAERYAEIRNTMIAECMEQCDKCGDGDLAISGPTSLVKPGGSQYSVSGGSGNYSLRASGNGASMDANGYLTLASDACGSVSITATDDCGRSAVLNVIIPNAGRWVRTDSNESKCPPSVVDFGYCDSGNTRTWVYADDPATYPNVCRYLPWWGGSDPDKVPICLLAIQTWQC